MVSTYQKSTDNEIHEKVRQRHRVAIKDLKRAGLQEYYFFGETVQALGFSSMGLMGVLGTVAALFNEVVKVESNLSVSIFNIVMVSKEYATYACPFGLGVKFYTLFTDGTGVVSANFDTPAINDDKEKLYKLAAPQTIVAAWKTHQLWVEELCSEGKQKIEHLSFADFQRLAQQEDSYMWRNKNSMVFRDLAPSIISIIIFMGLLVGFVYLFLIFAAFLQALYPACLVLGEKTPVSQMALIALACFVTSWTLARLQEKTSTIDGIGTKMFGRFPSSDSQGYVSTKWLTIIFLPIVPVRSYHVLEEQSTSGNKPYYSIKPLDHLQWAQIKETVWQSKVEYTLMFLVLIGLSISLIWKCL